MIHCRTGACLVLEVSWLLDHTLLLSLAIALAAFAMRLSISLSSDRLLEMIEPSEVVSNLKHLVVNSDGGGP